MHNEARRSLGCASVFVKSRMFPRRATTSSTLLHVFLQVWSLGETTDAKVCLQANSCVQETLHKDYASRDVQKELFGPDGQRISVIDKGLDLLASLAEVYLLNRFSEQAE